MDWPRQPVEYRRDFRPPFCPRHDCRAHRDRQAFRWQAWGTYLRRGDRRRVRRFRCLTCRRTFSQQTFACTYYLKRSSLLVPIAAGLLAGSAHRQLARSLGCSATTVTRISQRLGRHALLFCWRSLRKLESRGGLTEPVVYDDFETFVGAQEQACGIGTAVGRRSWFVYAFDHAPHRAGGVAPARRKGVPPSPGSYRRASTRVLELLTRLAGSRRLRWTTDDHPGYRAALRRLPVRSRIEHRVFANPPRGPRGEPRSPAARRRDREMFPVDLLHLLMRHSLAHHRRETIAFSRRLESLLERTFLLVLWRNFVKRRSERRARARTPAMVLGLADAPLDWFRVLARRLFPRRLDPPPLWRSIYRRDRRLAETGALRAHRLRLAF